MQEAAQRGHARGEGSRVPRQVAGAVSLRRLPAFHQAQRAQQPADSACASRVRAHQQSSSATTVYLTAGSRATVSWRCVHTSRALRALPLEQRWRAACCVLRNAAPQVLQPQRNQRASSLLQRRLRDAAAGVQQVRRRSLQHRSEHAHRKWFHVLKDIGGVAPRPLSSAWCDETSSARAASVACARHGRCISGVCCCATAPSDDRAPLLRTHARKRSGVRAQWTAATPRPSPRQLSTKRRLPRHHGAGSRSLRALAARSGSRYQRGCFRAASAARHRNGAAGCAAPHAAWPWPDERPPACARHERAADGATRAASVLSICCVCLRLRGAAVGEADAATVFATGWTQRRALRRLDATARPAPQLGHMHPEFSKIMMDTASWLRYAFQVRPLSRCCGAPPSCCGALGRASRAVT